MRLRKIKDKPERDNLHLKEEIRRIEELNKVVRKDGEETHQENNQLKEKLKYFIVHSEKQENK